MRISGKEVVTPWNFWVPDYTDFTLPRKPDGSTYSNLRIVTDQ